MNKNMATLHTDGNTSLSSDGDGEAQPPTAIHPDGWGAASSIIATVFGLMLAAEGWFANITVFLINEFNIKRIDAIQIANVVSGCIIFFYVVGAILVSSSSG